MSGGFDFLVSSVEERYDYQSARSVTREALGLAGLAEADKYSDADLKKFADALNALGGGRLDNVWSKLGVAPSGAPAPAPPAEEPKAEKKADKKADKKDDKKDDDGDKKKADAKKDDDKKDDKKKGGKKK